jgi:hypothetical protein
MNRLLANAPERARSCLEAQMGALAGRNSCTSPWQSSLDLQLNIRPAAWGLNRRLTVSVLGLNTLAGLDQLLHGANNLHGWGQPSSPDRTLLYVRGFDPQSGQFLYTVNEHFGAANSSRTPFRSPFQLAIQARLTVGPDPAREGMRRIFGGANGQPLTAEDFKTRLARAIPDPFERILAIKDSVGLALTPQQVSRLQLLSDSLRQQSEPVIDSLAAVLAGAAKNPDPQVFGRQLRPKMQAARLMAAAAIKQAQAVLTPAQWAKVPQSIKMPFRPYQGGQEGPGQGPGERMRRPPNGGGPPDQ